MNRRGDLPVFLCVRFARLFCTSVCSKSLTIKTLQSATISGNAAVCSGSAISLCGPTGRTAYQWSNGDTSRCTSITAPGTYTLTVTGTNGCTNKSSKTIVSGSTPSCCTTNCTSTICPGGSTQVCAPAGLSKYQWSTGATTQCITATAAGTYTITVTNNAGCSNSCVRTVTIPVVDDNNPCTTDACNPTTGGVTHMPINTDDNNVCTTDGCDPVTGPYHTPNNACCNGKCQCIISNLG